MVTQQALNLLSLVRFQVPLPKTDPRFLRLCGEQSKTNLYRRSSTERILGYEPGGGGSIPSGGATQ